MKNTNMLLAIIAALLLLNVTVTMGIHDHAAWIADNVERIDGRIAEAMY